MIVKGAADKFPYQPPKFQLKFQARSRIDPYYPWSSSAKQNHK